MKQPLTTEQVRAVCAAAYMLDQNSVTISDMPIDDNTKWLSLVRDLANWKLRDD